MRKIKKDRIRKEAEYWDKFEQKASEYDIPIWVDYQKANTPEIPFINFSTDPEIDRLYLSELKEGIIKRAGKGRILDLGCGSGWLCLELARRGAQVKGIDVSAKRITVARNYAKKERSRIDYSVEDIEDYKWVKREYYDTVVNWNSLHHIEDTEETLRHIAVSLKKGGLFISWDHIGDNFLVKFATKIASFIPRYYKAKTKVLGTVHSEAEGIARIRIKRDSVSKFLTIREYQERFIFVHLIPALYKFVRHKLHIPFPKMVFLAILGAAVFVDKVLSKLLPGLGTYSFVVARKK